MFSGSLVILVAAMCLDRIVGDPDWLWRRLPHPVVLFGTAIGWADRAFNHETLGRNRRRLAGVLAIGVLLAVSLAAGWGLHRLLASTGLSGAVAETLIVAILLAQKSLGDHVERVAVGLRQEGLAGGRRAVAMIVGRDPDTLDAPAVCRAAIESLAENFSDGVVAPALWYAVLGLPGLFAYKMLNTADSMIGHKTPRYLDFGWASARLDDLANLPAARLSLLLVAGGAALCAGRAAARNALDIGLRDHGLHRSPNSGWPEAAMAGALDLQLAGPRIYAGVPVAEPMINARGNAVASVKDIEKGIAIFYASCLIFTLLFVSMYIVGIL